MDDSRLTRLREDLEKARKKRDDWDARVKDLERKYNEAEKVYVYGIFQTANLTPEQLAELIRLNGTVLLQAPGRYVTDDNSNAYVLSGDTGNLLWEIDRKNIKKAANPYGLTAAYATEILVFRFKR